MKGAAGRRPLAGFTRRLSGLFIPRNARLHDQSVDLKAYRESVVNPVRVVRSRVMLRKTTLKPAAHVKHDNRKRNKAARKARRKNRE